MIYTEYVYPFEIAAVLLLVAMVVHTEAYDQDGTKQVQLRQINDLMKKAAQSAPGTSKHNMVSENYCGLDCICVGTHESNPTVPECTNCDSFVKRCGTEC